MKEYIDEIKNRIKSSMAEYERNLIIAKKINQKEPIFFETDVNNYKLISEPNPIYHKGSIVLSQQIIYFKELLNQLDNYSFNYNYIFQKPVTNTVMKGVKDRKIFIFYGFVLIFVSIMIVFIKNKII